MSFAVAGPAALFSALSCAGPAVAVGWSGYLDAFLDATVGFRRPAPRCPGTW